MMCPYVDLKCTNHEMKFLHKTVNFGLYKVHARLNNAYHDALLATPLGEIDPELDYKSSITMYGLMAIGVIEHIYTLVSDWGGNS